MVAALYVLTSQYRQLADQLAEGDFDAATVADTIEASGIVDDINTKAANCTLMAKSLVQYVPTIDAEINRLEALKERAERNSSALMDYVKTCMESSGISKITCPLFELAMVFNPPSVYVIDPLSVPDEYLAEQKPAPPRAPDKKKIGEALKSGKDLGFARLSQSTRLRVT
jgi:hypothetical protein